MKDFIAFGVISTIDDIIVLVIKNLDVEEAVEGQTFEYKMVSHKDLEGNKCLFYFYKFLKSFLFRGLDFVLVIFFGFIPEK